jgi:hypothetical protein
LLPSGSPIESPDVVRALHVALAAIDAQIRRSDRNALLLSNAAKPWCDKDDQELAELFDSGCPIADISTAFQRTPGSIASRLLRLGKALPAG